MEPCGVWGHGPGRLPPVRIPVGREGVLVHPEHVVPRTVVRTTKHRGEAALVDPARRPAGGAPPLPRGRRASARDWPRPGLGGLAPRLDLGLIEGLIPHDLPEGLQHGAIRAELQADLGRNLYASAEHPRCVAASGFVALVVPHDAHQPLQQELLLAQLLHPVVLSAHRGQQARGRLLSQSLELVSVGPQHFNERCQPRCGPIVVPPAPKLVPDRDLSARLVDDGPQAVALERPPVG
mmetsp:Transcript_24807/g.57478  ORF Transcript_24807/g.57478 Transcript_24807/m.57478 type:complete len:237 (-) Transcript_24807:365-1075(-)